MIASAKIDKISRIYWLIEDCKRYGTLPFAGLARAGFIAVQLLQSFVAAGVISAEEHATFMTSVAILHPNLDRGTYRVLSRSTASQCARQ